MSTDEQMKDFFDTFGYLALRGVLRDDIDWITSEFENVFVDHGVVHDGDRRTCIVPFIDQRERLCTLLDHPVLSHVAQLLLGADFQYVASDGNYYTGDTGWHSDGFHDNNAFVKMAFYLDPVDADSGCLRVIPGSHRPAFAGWAARRAADSQARWGIAHADVPAVPLASRPGDVLVFNHNLMHSSVGGGRSRRMFTMNLAAAPRTDADRADFRHYINDHARFHIDSIHGVLMRDTGPATRQAHLAVVMDNEDELPELSRLERAKGGVPANG